MTDGQALNLSRLGAKTPIPASPEAAVPECVPTPHPGETYLVRSSCPEFTSLCPMTDLRPFDRADLERRDLNDVGVLLAAPPPDPWQEAEMKREPFYWPD